eukprot:scaffold9199_cov81-Skeletonema_marinoi.AAC.3
MSLSGTFETPRQSDKGYRCGKYVRKGSNISRIKCSSVFGTIQMEGVPRLRALLALDSRGTHSAVGIFVGSCQRLPLPQISEVVADSSKIPSQEAAVDEEFNVES